MMTSGLIFKILLTSTLAIIIDVLIIAVVDKDIPDVWKSFLGGIFFISAVVFIASLFLLIWV